MLMIYLTQLSNNGMGILRSIQLVHMGEIKIIYEDYTLFLSFFLESQKKTVNHNAYTK